MRIDACVACDRARDERIERDGCCVTDAPLSLRLSLSLTHTQVNYKTILSCIHNISASVYVSLMHDHLHIHTSLCLYHTHTVSTLPFRHNTHMDTYTRSLSVTHTKSVLKNRAHLKRQNPNKHELELNSNIWKYCSFKNFSRKKKLSNIQGLFSHTQKVLVDVLQARHGDAPFDRPRGRGSRACTRFCIMALVLTNKSVV